MALPTPGAVRAAVETLYAALTEDKTIIGARTAVQSFNEIAPALNRAYPGVVDVAIVDETDANVAAFIGVGGQGEALDVGDIFRCVNATADLTDNALATAKGSAVAVGDIFSIETGTTAAYLGNNGGVAFDFAGATSDDFGRGA